MNRLFLTLLRLGGTICAQAQEKIRVACVGNSITYGSGVANREVNAYPVKLQGMLGDGMIIVNALCSAIASLLTRSLVKRVDVFVGTGYSLALGGILLLVTSLLLCATLPQITWWGLVILLLLIGISALGFALYNKLISCNPVGKVAIFNSLIPVVGAITSCMCLGEPFYRKYVVAAVLATAGIYIINKQKN